MAVANASLWMRLLSFLALDENDKDKHIAIAKAEAIKSQTFKYIDLHLPMWINTQSDIFHITALNARASESRRRYLDFMSPSTECLMTPPYSYGTLLKPGSISLSSKDLDYSVCLESTFGIRHEDLYLIKEVVVQLRGDHDRSDALRYQQILTRLFIQPCVKKLNIKQFDILHESHSELVTTAPRILFSKDLQIMKGKLFTSKRQYSFSAPIFATFVDFESLPPGNPHQCFPMSQSLQNLIHEESITEY